MVCTVLTSRSTIFLFRPPRRPGRDSDLPFLQHPPCPWDRQTCKEAAEYGRLDVLQWARAQHPPCPWDEDTCRAAVFDYDGPHWDVLRWLRVEANPSCPWDADSKAAAEAHFGEAEVASWPANPDDVETDEDEESESDSGSDEESDDDDSVF